MPERWQANVAGSQPVGLGRALRSGDAGIWWVIVAHEEEEELGLRAMRASTTPTNASTARR